MSSQPTPQDLQQSDTPKSDNRGLWLITAYAGSFVALLAILVYYWWQLPH